MPQILDASGDPVPPARIAAARAFAQTRPYRGASQNSQELGMYNAPLLSAHAANRWDRQILANRARDLVRNESEAAASVTKSVGMAIGSGWKLQSKPHAETLGISKEEARKLGRSIERAFSRWASNPLRFCDSNRRHDFGGLLRLAFHEWETVNDVLITMGWRETPLSDFATCVRIVDTDRLSNPHGRPDDEYLREGIVLDDFGAETGYHILKYHPGEIYTARGVLDWEYVPRETAYGRPVGIHGFTQTRAEQIRGVTSFAPIIETFVMLGKYKSAEVKSALINALFGAFVKSGFDPQAVAEILGIEQAFGDNVTSFQDTRMGFYEDKPVTLDGVRIPVLMPGDEVDLNTAPRQASAFKEFYRTLTQSIAAIRGVSHGQITGDYTGLNFSTLRGAFNEIWDMVFVKRADFGAQIVKPVMLCVLDEAEDKDMLDIPAGCPPLWEAPDAWCRSEWIGPARGQIDPEKESKGHLLRLDAGLASRTRIAAANGEDIDDIIAEIADENEKMNAAGVSPEFRDAGLAPTSTSSSS